MQWGMGQKWGKHIHAEPIRVPGAEGAPETRKKK